MFTLPKIPYSYDAFNGNYSKELLELHHSKHHQAYVDKLNAAIANYPEVQAIELRELVKNYKNLPAEIQTPVRNFAGGHYNHTLLWQLIMPNANLEPTGELLAAINEKFGNFSAFKEQFTAKAMSLFGSGWTWLLSDLSIMNTANQDNPISEDLAEPILCVDVWEHAYYVDYTFKRADFIAAFWNTINWDEVSKRYAEFK